MMLPVTPSEILIKQEGFEDTWLPAPENFAEFKYAWKITPEGRLFWSVTVGNNVDNRGFIEKEGWRWRNQ